MSFFTPVRQITSTKPLWRATKGPSSSSEYLRKSSHSGGVEWEGEEGARKMFAEQLGNNVPLPLWRSSCMHASGVPSVSGLTEQCDELSSDLPGRHQFSLIRTGRIDHDRHISRRSSIARVRSSNGAGSTIPASVRRVQLLSNRPKRHSQQEDPNPAPHLAAPKGNAQPTPRGKRVCCCVLHATKGLEWPPPSESAERTALRVGGPDRSARAHRCKFDPQQ